MCDGAGEDEDQNIVYFHTWSQKFAQVYAESGCFNVEKYALPGGVNLIICGGIAGIACLGRSSPVFDWVPPGIGPKLSLTTRNNLFRFGSDGESF